AQRHRALLAQGLGGKLVDCLLDVPRLSAAILRRLLKIRVLEADKLPVRLRLLLELSQRAQCAGNVERAVPHEPGEGRIPARPFAQRTRDLSDARAWCRFAQ